MSDMCSICYRDVDDGVACGDCSGLDEAHEEIAQLKAERERLRKALLNDPSDGTCRLCGCAPTDERKLCHGCFDELSESNSEEPGR